MGKMKINVHCQCIVLLSLKLSLYCPICLSYFRINLVPFKVIYYLMITEVM
jgi:hypothetical protein